MYSKKPDKEEAKSHPNWKIYSEGQDEYLAIPKNIESYADSHIVNLLLEFAAHLRINLISNTEDEENSLKAESAAFWRSLGHEILY